MPTPGSQALPAARARGGVPAVGARSMARGPLRPCRPRTPGSGLCARCALGTFRLRQRRLQLLFRQRVGSRSGSARRRVPAAPSVCSGEAAASLPPSGARRLHRGNHGDGAHPGRAASLKGQASRQGSLSPRDLGDCRGGSGSPSQARGPLGPPHAAPPAPRRRRASAWCGWADSAAGARRLSLEHGGSHRASSQPLLPAPVPEESSGGG